MPTPRSENPNFPHPPWRGAKSNRVKSKQTPNPSRSTYNKQPDSVVLDAVYHHNDLHFLLAFLNKEAHDQQLPRLWNSFIYLFFLVQKPNSFCRLLHDDDASPPNQVDAARLARLWAVTAHLIRHDLFIKQVNLTNVRFNDRTILNFTCSNSGEIFDSCFFFLNNSNIQNDFTYSK